MSNKLIAKNTGVLFIRLILTSFIGLFTSRFVFQSLGVSDFGLYSVVGGIIVIMSFLNTSLSSTTYTFLAVEIGKGSKGNPNKIFNTSLVIHVFLAVLLILVTEVLGVYYVKNHLSIDQSKLSDALYVLRLSSWSAAISIVSIPFQGLIIAEEKFFAQSLIEIIRSVLSFLVAYLLLTYTGNKIRYYTILISIVNVLPCIMMFAYCLIKFKEIVSWTFQKTFHAYKEILSYTGWITFGSLGWVGQREGAALLVNSFFGTTLNASMSIALQVNNMAMILSKNLGQAAIPQITKSVSGNDSSRTKILVANISKYSCFLMLIPALPLLLETKFLLGLWLGKVPVYTILFCQLIIINSLIESFSAGLPSVIMASGKVKIFMICGGVISFLGVPIVFILFKIGAEPYTVSLVFILTSISNILVNQVLLKKIINYDIIYFIKTVYLRVFLVLILLTPLFILRDFFQPSFFRLFCMTATSLIWLFSVIYFFGIENEERKTFQRVVLKFIK